MAATGDSSSAGSAGAPSSELATLQRLLGALSGGSGTRFFTELTGHLAVALGSRHARLAELRLPAGLRTVAEWQDGAAVQPTACATTELPSREAVASGTLEILEGVGERYPGECAGVESYVGTPLRARDGTVLGLLCAWDPAALAPDPRRVLLLELFAAHAAVELDRLRLERQLRDSEERFRDLFDEAPIAYVHEGLDLRFIRANRTAMRVLGIRPEEVAGSYGSSFIPNTREAQRRITDALATIGKGTESTGILLELQRRDDGRPIWVQWWSRPSPSGDYTRTMFIDVTERVLMEQEQTKLRAQNRYLQEEIKSVHNFEEIIGASAGLLRVLESVRRVAPTDATVLISGETGTGKELIARAIHSASSRADRPFIKLNCAALPPGLVESELFGHERGAFGGALQRRIGRFELAHTGTIFLDEIGQMPLDVQVKLLRVLQERGFERVGSSQTQRADVRVLAATNRDLRKAVRDGEFREALFYRLNVFPVDLPPLRERTDDIPLLVRFFVQKYAPRVGRRIEEVERETLERLARYPWPGNIRELENIVERTLILVSGHVLQIAPELLPAAAVVPATAPELLPAAAVVPATAPAPTAAAAPAAQDLAGVQREHTVGVLRATRWVIECDRGAARQLGVHPNTLRHRMKKLGISRVTEASGAQA